MVLFHNKEECHGCGLCRVVCPNSAIEMKADAEGFFYPKIQEERCIDCGGCRQVCENIHQIEEETGYYYAVRCEDERLLQKSTSGGAFSLIAEEILKDGGIVCGACMDETCHIIHRLSEEIDGMRKAKYVQSDISHLYTEIEAELKSGREVLFSGTPCQCQAIRQYFLPYGKQLVTAALICRGVQSPELWSEYLSYLGENGSVSSYDFRDKSVCNDAHTVAYSQNGEMHRILMNMDRFSRLYIKCLTLRPSCYQCEFCRTELPFDFTLGDFWGIEKIFPELADGKGTSLVIARGKQANERMKKIQKQAKVYSCSKEEAMQPALQEPAKKTILRKFLFRDLADKKANGHCDMELILKKYGQ